nr:hypothetical protein [Methylobacterium oxalidis]
MSLCVPIIVLGSIIPGFADTTALQRAACTPDVWRLCSSEIPDVAGITACLRRAKPKLSPACRDVFTAADRTRSVGL